MYFAALATDYDGTLAKDGHVDAETCAALRRVHDSGRKLILVTGRELPELQSIFPEYEMFDLLVMENGALLYDPKTREETPLAPPPPEEFVKRLVELQVTPLAVGQSIVASREPNEKIILETIKALGLELNVIFNKGAVMVLPANINKATGMMAALERLKLSPHNVVGIGDAENDHAFLIACGCAAAVGNAIPSLKEKVDLIVSRHGQGVVELAERLLQSDLRDVGFSRLRPRPEIGWTDEGDTLYLDPFGDTLVAGNSLAGNVQLVRALIVEACELGFQCLIFDCDSDYADLEGVVNVGSASHEPDVGEIMSLLEQPDESVVVTLSSLGERERSRFLARILPEIADLREQTGRPHWLVLGRAHRLLPATHKPALPRKLPALVAVRAHPELSEENLLRRVSTFVGVGKGAADILAGCLKHGFGSGRVGGPEPIDDGEALVITGKGMVEKITVANPRAQERHKYADERVGGAAR